MRCRLFASRSCPPLPQTRFLQTTTSNTSLALSRCERKVFPCRLAAPYLLFFAFCSVTRYVCSCQPGHLFRQLRVRGGGGGGGSESLRRSIRPDVVLQHYRPAVLVFMPTVYTGITEGGSSNQCHYLCCCCGCCGCCGTSARLSILNDQN